MEPSSLESTFARFAATRDAHALADVFDATAPELARVARHLTRDESEAEDVVQATFLEAMEHSDRFDASRPLLPWLVGILQHQAHDARRRSQRCLDATRLAQERPRDAAREASSREFFAQLAHAVHDLPETYRVVLAPHIDGRTSPEIGKELGLEDGTVRVRIHRGLALLRKLLPPGFLAGALFVELTPRGLAAVRESLTTAAVATSAGALAGAGGLFVVNKFILGAIAVVLAGALWFSRPADVDGVDSPTTANAPTISALPSTDPADVSAASTASTTAAKSDAPLVAERSASIEVDVPSTPWSRGHVRRAVDLAPIRNASVHGHMWDRTLARFDFDTITGADGSFDVPATFIKDGRLRGLVAANADGFARGRESTTSVDPQPFVVDIRLVPSCTLEGRVARDDGTALADVSIEVFDDLGPYLGRLSTRTDARGEYRIAGFEPSRLQSERYSYGTVVKATDERGRTLAVATTEVPSQATLVRCDLVAHGERSFDVIVRSKDDDRAIAEANVVVLGTLGASWFAERVDDYPVGVRGRTDNEGRFSVTGVFGPAVDVFAVAPGYASEVHRIEGSGFTSREITLTLERGATVGGILLRADGSPFGGEPLRIQTDETPSMFTAVDSPLATVWRIDDDAWQRNPFRLTTTTADDGRFVFESVPVRETASIAIGVAKQGTQQEVFGPFALAPGDTKSDLVIRVAARTRVEVQVQDDSGHTLTEHVCVGLSCIQSVWDPVDDTGVYVLDLPAGPLPPIAVAATGFCTQVVTSEQLGAGSVIVRLVRGKSVSGVVVDDAGSPVAGVTVMAMPAHSASAEAKRVANWFTTGITVWRATTAADGTFSIDGIHDVPLDLSVDCRGYGSYMIRDMRPGTRDLRLIVVPSPAR